MFMRERGYSRIHCALPTPVAYPSRAGGDSALCCRVWPLAFGAVPMLGMNQPSPADRRRSKMRATLVGNRYHFFRHLSENTAHRTRVRRQNVEDQAKENKKIKSEDDGPRVRSAVKTMCEAFKPPPAR
jgi:hypothetical protein